MVGVTRRAGEFAISKPVREALYTAVPREERYKAKSFIDTVVYRGGDATSGWLFGSLRGAGLGLSALAWSALPVAAVLILKITDENQLDKNTVEQLAQDRFSKGVKQSNKLEASGLIEELIEKYPSKGKRQTTPAK